MSLRALADRPFATSVLALAALGMGAPGALPATSTATGPTAAAVAWVAMADREGVALPLAKTAEGEKSRKKDGGRGGDGGDCTSQAASCDGGSGGNDNSTGPQHNSNSDNSKKGNDNGNNNGNGNGLVGGGRRA